MEGLDIEDDPCLFHTDPSAMHLKWLPLKKKKGNCTVLEYCNLTVSGQEPL